MPAPLSAGAATPGGDSAVIEGLRGLAALLVVVAHYRGQFGAAPGWLAFTFTGVDLFFVISGYVFAPHLLGRRIEPGAFALRRFFRIVPLYALGVLVYAAVRLDGLGQWPLVLRHLLFLHTLETREIAFALNPAFWSLPPEVEFYVALPLLALACRSTGALLVGAGVAALLHLAIASALPADPTAVTTMGKLAVHLPGLLVEFMVGALAWRWRVQGAAPGRRLALAALGLLVLALLAALFARLGDAGIAGHLLLRGNLSLLAACGYGVLVAALATWPLASERLARVAAGLGALSYGTYIFHNLPPLVLPRLGAPGAGPVLALLSLAVTLALAALLHRAVERPARAWGRELAARREARVAAAARG